MHEPLADDQMLEAGLSAFWTLADHWGLTAEQQNAILVVADSTRLRWRAGQLPAALPDLLDRLQLVLLTHPTKRLACAALALAAVLSCKDSAPPQIPTTLTLSAPALSLDAIGARDTIAVTVRDQNGEVMQHASVTWTANAIAVATVVPLATPPSATPPAPPATSAATVTAVTNGAATITVQAGTITTTLPVSVLQAAVVPQKVAGDAQTGAAGVMLSAPLQVSIRDRLGNPIAGRTVTFTVTQGGGTVSTGTAISAADGSAAASWTLGTVAAAPQQTTVSVAGATTGAVFTATAVAGPAAVGTITAGNNQTATVGTTVPIPPAVRVADAFNNPVAGTNVIFAIVSGGGGVTGTFTTTNSAGIATVGSWTLGTTPGVKTMVGAPIGLAQVLFSATATVGPPVAMAAQSGNNQIATAGTAVLIAPSVRITDVFGNPVPGIGVTFAVASDGGTTPSTPATTDAAGLATSGGWTLGATLGINTLTATVSGSGITGNPATFSATGVASGGGSSSGFNIDLRFLTSATASQAQAFINAAARWRSIITAKLPDVVMNVAAGTCGSNSPALNETVDDLLIFVTLEPIDGPGGVLGSAGPCYIRTVGNLTVVGRMRFDVADLATLEANGQLESVVLHEMGHVLGIGSLWTTFGLLANPSLPSSPGVDTRFTGTNAIAGFDAIGGATYTGGGKVPVENTQGGAGTRDVHWRESVLQNELMTGFINAGSNPLSVLTIRSLQDFGYTVNVGAADPFFLSLSLRAQSQGSVPAAVLLNDVNQDPIRVVDTKGRMVRILRP